ncbi:MAG TPA: heavy-metal-associated domain-containing protein [Gemmatimonadaceae bacterium]|nr:heavy-metal-associated domain-containing protein [Gemmatimonadaceae bacterium]
MRTILRLRLPSVHSVRAVHTALQGVEGIVRADVSRTGATIDHDGRATAARLREAIETAGYDVVEIIQESRRLSIKEE